MCNIWGVCRKPKAEAGVVHASIGFAAGIYGLGVYYRSNKGGIRAAA